MRQAAICILIVIVCAACGSPPALVTPSPEPTVTPTSRFNTSAAPFERATLPPTWTPTYTRTATPVTPTSTPTPTATPTPIPDRADVCDGISVTYPYPPGHVFTTDQTISFVFFSEIILFTEPITRTGSIMSVDEDERDTSLTMPGGIAYAHGSPPQRVDLLFTVVNRETRQGIGGRLPSGDAYGVQIPAASLPHLGAHDWSLIVSAAQSGRLCTFTGNFTVEAAQNTAAIVIDDATAESTSSTD